MKKYSIPTASYEVFDDPEAALAYIESAPVPAVIKADGLALGKGVVIAQTREEAAEAVNSMMRDRIFGESGARIVIEEFLTGPEVSVLSFTDGKTVVPMVSSMDHKRAGDGEPRSEHGRHGNRCAEPVLYGGDRAGMHGHDLSSHGARDGCRGREFRGCLYFGLMLTPTDRR